jgi:lysophospholipase L1-like esterase
MRYGLAVLIAVCLLLNLSGCGGQNPQKQPVRLESTEWNDVWIINADKSDLPRVLMVGDSIVVGYGSRVEKALAGKAYCGQYATSKYCGNPDYLSELEIILKRHRYDVIHINNGLHGLEYSQPVYRQDLERLLVVLKKYAPKAQLIWATTTPVRMGNQVDKFNPEQNGIVIRLNEIAIKLMRENDIPVDDLYAVVKDHPEYSANDGLHYNDAGRDELAKAVTREILERLHPQGPAIDNTKSK